MLIDGGNAKSKTVSEQLSKVTEDLIKIQKKTKRYIGSTTTQTTENYN